MIDTLLTTDKDKLPQHLFTTKQQFQFMYKNRKEKVVLSVFVGFMFQLADNDALLCLLHVKQIVPLHNKKGQ